MLLASCFFSCDARRHVLVPTSFFCFADKLTKKVNIVQLIPFFERGTRPLALEVSSPSTMKSGEGRVPPPRRPYVYIWSNHSAVRGVPQHRQVILLLRRVVHKNTSDHVR